MKRQMITAELMILELNSLAPAGSLLAAEPVGAGKGSLPEFLSELLPGAASSTRLTLALIL